MISIIGHIFSRNTITGRLRFALMAGMLLTGCGDKTMQWDDIVTSGVLRYATVENPATYYVTPPGPAGFEYELARRFADQYGLELQVLVADTAYEAINLVQYQKASIAGAALIKTPLPYGLVFGPDVYTVPQQLIYRNGENEPDPVDSIERSEIDVTIAQYLALKNQYPLLPINRHEDITSLVESVQNNTINSTVANANMVDAFRYLYPDIRVARDLTEPQPVAWVYNGRDKMLDRAVTDFIRELNSSGELTALLERHFGHLSGFDYVDITTFIRRVNNRLPQYEPLFRKVADKYNLDWTLLAAMSYQESHWDESARSPTGVRGLMMLTQNTAGHVGIEDRLDPEQSIEGGARYYLELLDKIPGRIPFPDRMWFALAAYNIGFLHLENARIITESNGGDPDSWAEVRNTLVDISEEDEYLHLQAGQIRWREPVRYVRNIRKYQDALRWQLMQQEKATRKSLRATVPVINSPAI